ncbi:MAG: hypothetical protein J5858_12830 [Lentisphaeria bacterium]|nr:hypothetical protein [Lentisphaeria bacterium]
MNRITKEQVARLDMLYAHGQFEGIAPGEFSKLTSADAKILIQKAEQVMPGTYSPIDETTREDLEVMLSGGKFPFTPDDLRYLSVIGAETLLWLSFSSDRNREYVITKSQQRRLRSLIDRGFLHKMSEREILLLSEEKADKLILQGEENALYGQEG